MKLLTPSTADLTADHSIPTFGYPFTYYDDEERQGIDNREGRLPLSVDWELRKEGDKYPPMGVRDTTLIRHADLPSLHARSKIKHAEEFQSQFKAAHALFNTSLITSRDPAHSARTLCGSVSSVGPDFVSLSEGLFCDMGYKKLWRICTEDEQSDCFDRELNRTRSADSGTILGKRDSPYTSFRDW